MDEIEHVVDSLEDAEEVGLGQDGVQPVDELPEGQHLAEAGQTYLQQEITREGRCFLAHYVFGTFNLGSLTL